MQYCSSILADKHCVCMWMNMFIKRDNVYTNMCIFLLPTMCIRDWRSLNCNLFCQAESKQLHFNLCYNLCHYNIRHTCRYQSQDLIASCTVLVENNSTQSRSKETSRGDQSCSQVTHSQQSKCLRQWKTLPYIELLKSPSTTVHNAILPLDIQLASCLLLCIWLVNLVPIHPPSWSLNSKEHMIQKLFTSRSAILCMREWSYQFLCMIL